MIIDTHCHLDDKSFDNDIAQVIANARENGVGGVLIPGADINDLPKAAKIAHEKNDIFFAVGVHPYDKENFDIETLRECGEHVGLYSTVEVKDEIKNQLIMGDING